MSGFYREGDVVFGSWILDRKIGEGSFGQVYEASRTEFGEVYKAAVKIITIPQNESEVKSARAEGMDDLSITKYFRSLVEEIVQEFALMAKLKGNSHIVSYEDHMVIGREDSIGWDILIRMELLTPLLDYIQRQPLSRMDVIKLGIDITKGLELCQKHNIMHRDIKPENIFLSDAGDFKLGDFGIARTVEKTTGGLSKKGTYTYMAPEVYKDEPYGSSVDIYSLGLVMYRLLNENRAPFLPAYPAPITHSDRENALAHRISGGMIPPPKNADGRLAEIVLKACAYQPRDRYSSPLQMRAELEAIQYNRAESNVLYPAGDEVPILSERNVPTGTPPSVPMDATEEVFRQPPVTSQYDKTTLPDQEEETTFEKTQSVFGPAKPVAPPDTGQTAPRPDENGNQNGGGDVIPHEGGTSVKPQAKGKKKGKRWLSPGVAGCVVGVIGGLGLLSGGFVYPYSWPACIAAVLLTVLGLAGIFGMRHIIGVLPLMGGTLLAAVCMLQPELRDVHSDDVSVYMWLLIIASFFLVYFADRYVCGVKARKAGAADPEQMSPWVGGFYVCFWCAMAAFYDLILYGNLIRVPGETTKWVCLAVSALALLAGLFLLFVLKDAIAMWPLLAGCIAGPACLSNNFLDTALGMDGGKAMGIWLWLHVFGSLLLGAFIGSYLSNKKNAKHTD